MLQARLSYCDDPLTGSIEFGPAVDMGILKTTGSWALDIAVARTTAIANESSTRLSRQSNGVIVLNGLFRWLVRVGRSNLSRLGDSPGSAMKKPWLSPKRLICTPCFHKPLLLRLVMATVAFARL